MSPDTQEYRAQVEAAREELERRVLHPRLPPAVAAEFKQRLGNIVRRAMRQLPEPRHG